MTIPSVYWSITVRDESGQSVATDADVLPVVTSCVPAAATSLTRLGVGVYQATVLNSTAGVSYSITAQFVVQGVTYTMTKVAYAGGVALADAKAHLRIETDAEDVLLAGLIDAAVAYARKYTASPGLDVTDPAAKVAVLLLVGHWYTHREAAMDRTITEIPLGVEPILNLYRQGVVV